MSAFLGMDPKAVRAQADRLRDASSDLAQLRSQLDGAVRGVAWEGVDADAFAQQWGALATPGMDSLSARLERLGFDLQAQADEQDLASEPGSHVRGRIENDATSLIPPDAREILDKAAEFIDGLPRGLQNLLPDTPWAEIIASGLVDGVEGIESFLEQGRDFVKDLPWPFNHLGDSLPDGDIEILDERADVEILGPSRHVLDSEAPQDLDDLIFHNDETRRRMHTEPPGRPFEADDHAQIRIQTIRGADGQERYIVHVPPTQGVPLMPGNPGDVGAWPGVIGAWNEQGQPFGWANNIYAMAGRENAGANAVKGAMAEAGIPPGADIAFVGHSQGGLVASQLADDPAFNSSSGAEGSYNVTDIFTVGSPVQTYTPAQGSTNVLNVHHVATDEHGGDFVPKLDLEGRSARYPDGNPAENVQDVHLPTAAEDPRFPQDDDVHLAHDSVHRNPKGYSSTSGYYGSLRQHADHPDLVEKADRMSGTYMGDDVLLVDDVVIDARRK